jgi:hypothetical protein
MSPISYKSLSLHAGIRECKSIGIKTYAIKAESTVSKKPYTESALSNLSSLSSIGFEAGLFFRTSFQPMPHAKQN